MNRHDPLIIEAEQANSAFPCRSRFVVDYELTCLLTDGGWSKPVTQRKFRLADTAEEALAHVQAHLRDPEYFLPGIHTPSNARVTPCPGMSTCCGYLRFGGANDIRKSKQTR
jgi:hypothetical protein